MPPQNGTRTMAERKLGRPAGQNPTMKMAPNDATKQVCENIGDGWGLFLSFLRWFPDYMLDLFRADDADFELSILQRVILRVNARYRYCDIQGCRSLTKTFCTMTGWMVDGVLWPGLRTAYFGPGLDQTSKIAGNTWDVIEKNYPGLAACYRVSERSADRFAIVTPYGSEFSIRATRGLTFYSTIAEEYAQEGKVPFNHEDYRAVVKKSMRGEPRICGKCDPTYISYKQHSITSAGRRQNPSYQIRNRHFEAMMRGEKDAFVMDVPYGCLLLCRMRDIVWAEAQRDDTTPDEWAREMETRNSGSDQNPLVRDEVLTESRNLLMMEEHHCCIDRDCPDKPEDVIYVIGYDVSYADGPENAKCAAVVLKCKKQTFYLKRDKYIKQVVYIEDWSPTDPMRQADRLKRLWHRFTFPGSQTYIAIDAWQYGSAVVSSLMMDLKDGLAPLCIYNHAAFADMELPGAIPVIYPIKAGGQGTTDPDADMIRYAILQFENRNVQLLTSNFSDGMEAYKRYHRIKHDNNDGQIYAPYQKTNELIGQIQNLKTIPSGAGLSEKRISNKTQRDSWSALKYALRFAQRLEIVNLVKPKQEKSDWEKAAEQYMRHRPKPVQPRTRGLGRQGGRRFA